MNDDEEKAVVMYLITNHKTTAGELMSFVQITLDNFYRLKLDSVEGMITAAFMSILIVFDADYDLSRMPEYYDELFDNTEIKTGYPYRSSIRDKRQIRPMIAKCLSLAKKFKTALEETMLAPDDTIYIAGTTAVYMVKNTDFTKEDFMDFINMVSGYNRGDEK